MAKVKIVHIAEPFIKYMFGFDNRVGYNKSQTRPYLGVLFSVNGANFYAPLSSPKPKHKNMSNKMLDTLLIDGGTYGVINFNNMIPVKQSEIINYNINTEPDQKYKALLIKQFLWISQNEQKIIKQAYKLYDMYVKNKLPVPVKNRCCDFVKLLGVYKKYK